MSGIFGTAAEFKTFLMIVGGSLALFVIWMGVRRKMKGPILPQGETLGEYAWTSMGLSVWFFGGLVIDSWAHTHGEVDESFFTPWHAIFYSGFIGFMLFTISALWSLRDTAVPLRMNMASVKGFLGGMPAGFGAGVAGMVIFALAGAGDFLWHWIFGLEGGLDILLSTTHLLLATGMFLAVLAPFWAAWHRSDEGEDTFWGQLPMITSLAVALSVLTFFTRYGHPFQLTIGELSDDAGLQLTAISMELQSFILIGSLLLFMKRWTPARGTLSVLFLLNGISVAFQAPGELAKVPWIIGVYLGYGLLAELGNAVLKPASSIRGQRIFSFAFPFLFMFIWWAITSWGAGFSVTRDGKELVLGPFDWTLHATIGVFFLAGCFGLLTSLFMDPPKVPEKVDPVGQG